MLGIVKAIYKSNEFVEGYTFESKKQTVKVKDHYRIKIDEVNSEGVINQQTVIAYAENVTLVNKLQKLCMYQQVNFVVDITYYKGQPSKVVVLDVIDSEAEQEVVTNIFKKYER